MPAGVCERFASDLELSGGFRWVLWCPQTLITALLLLKCNMAENVTILKIPNWSMMWCLYLQHYVCDEVVHLLEYMWAEEGGLLTGGRAQRQRRHVTQCIPSRKQHTCIKQNIRIAQINFHLKSNLYLTISHCIKQNMLIAYRFLFT